MKMNKKNALFSKIKKECAQVGNICSDKLSVFVPPKTMSSKSRFVILK